MYPVKGSFRFKQIEDRYNADMEDLLYQMHWSEDMMHREIGGQLGIPRPTITKWFKLLNIPTQSCHRFTDKNLTSWLYKTGKLKKKPRYEGPDRRIQRTKGGLNVDFFKTWSPEMAYVLGYFAADGGMFINSGGSKYIQFVSTDYELLEKVRKILRSNHRIALKKKGNERCRDAYLLEIGAKEVYEDILKLGFTPNKESRINFPNIPNEYIHHFVRGYFDGDGCISYGYYKRKDRNNRKTFILFLRFASGSRYFLRNLSQKLHLNAGVGLGCLTGRNSGYHLGYSKNDTIRLFRYMYEGITQELFLERKYNKFREAFKILGT